jgi:hypothetical protein
MDDDNEGTKLRLAGIRLNYTNELFELLALAQNAGAREYRHMEHWAVQAAESLFVVDALKHKLLAGKSIIVACELCRNPLPMPDIARDNKICAACRGEPEYIPDPRLYVLSA